MNSSAVHLRLCDIANGPLCTVDVTGAACTALQTCRRANCLASADHLGAPELCEMASCADAFTQCYSTRCVPWLHPRLVAYNNTVVFDQDISTMDPALQVQVLRYRNVSIPEGSKVDPIAAEQSLAAQYNVSGGFCALSPPEGPCTTNDGIAVIPLQGSGSKQHSFPMAACIDNSSIEFTKPPGGVCNVDPECMSDKCFQQYCDDFGSNKREILSKLGMAGQALVALGFSVGFALWLRRGRARIAALRAAEGEQRAEQARLRQIERQRLQEEAAEEDEEENRLPEYKTTPDAGETRLEYSAPKANVENGAQDIELQTLPTPQDAGTSGDPSRRQPSESTL
ncbi:hypothetical protein RI367_008623 [Sorochytrium milnesiophthora]